MIGALSGTVAAVETADDGPATLIVDVAGVGYEVLVSNRLAESLAPIGSPVSLAVHTHVREGAITLYGFAGRAERRIFDQLISAHGIGPVLAIAILTVHTPASLAAAVAAGDVDALVLVPGVGKKTAQRLIVELAGRLEAGSALVTPLDNTDGTARTAAGEVREALASLGYAPDEVRAALERLPAEGTVEELLRDALSTLAPAR